MEYVFPCFIHFLALPEAYSQLYPWGVKRQHTFILLMSLCTTEKMFTISRVSPGEEGGYFTLPLFSCLKAYFWKLLL